MGVRGVRPQPPEALFLPLNPIPYWSKPSFWLLLAAIATVPFLAAPLPMLPDLFSHVGRWHVMNHGAGSPYLPHYYEFRWLFIGNLGVDLLMLPLGAVLPTEAAARVVVAIIPPLTVAGIHAVSRALWGRPQAPALLALLLLVPFPFAFGFVNYQLGLALALLALALWLKLRDGRWRWPAGLAAAAIVWVAHLAAWAVLLVAVVGIELARARPLSVRAIVVAGWRALPVALAGLLTLAQPAGAPAPPIFKPLMVKAFWVISLLRAEQQWLDVALAMLLLAAVVLLLRGGATRRAGPLLGAAGLGLCFLALPYQLLGSDYADARLLAPALMLALLGIGDGRRADRLALVALLLFGIRTAELAWGWQQRGAAARAELAVLAAVPRGARIAAIARPSSNVGWVLSGHDHLPSLAIVRREAFVDTLWDSAALKLMRPAYNRGRDYNDISASALESRPGAGDGRPLAAILAGLPRDRFDHVWSFDAPLSEPWLREVARGPHGRLYVLLPSRTREGAGAPEALLPSVVVGEIWCQPLSFATRRRSRSFVSSARVRISDSSSLTMEMPRSAMSSAFASPTWPTVRSKNTPISWVVIQSMKVR